METDIVGAMLDAAAMLGQPRMLFYIVLGVFIGTLLAVIPGVGALMGMALLLPFTFVLDAHTAIAFLLGALAIMTTADAIPAVLFGVPGTPGSMATVLDGYPMAKKGEAGRALGAAFTSSIVGGIVGALLLMAVLPVIMPVLMRTTSPELLAFLILGLSMVAALSGGSMMTGLAAASLGVLIAFIGQDAQTATLRWTFGSLYLWDGIHVLVVALGIYAIPELADLAIIGRSIAQDRAATGQLAGVRKGVMDTFRNFPIVLRSSGLSAAIGTLPAVGPAVIPWIVYSYTTMRTKGPSEFGRGDVRGVIAVESSNNATVGGSLLPTVALGIPGSAPMALLLGAFLLHGVAPGPDMLSKELSFTYMMVWTIVVANIIGGGLAFVLAAQLARLVFVRATILVPIILSIVFIGAVQASRQWEDLAFLLVLGALGWIMKRIRWSRSPFVLAFILAPLVERYYFISVSVHGWQWLLRPAVIVVLSLTVAVLVGLALHRRTRARQAGSGDTHRVFRAALDGESICALVVCAISVAAFVSAADWNPNARAMPQIVAVVAGVTSLGALLAGWWRPVGETAADSGAESGAESGSEPQFYDIVTDFGDLDRRAIGARALKYCAFILVFGTVALGIGVLPAVPVFVLVYMLTSGESWRVAVPVAVGTALFTYGVFEYLLALAWPVPAWNLLVWLG